VNVLLVEDNEDTASALHALFELEGIGCRWARTGSETLQLFASGDHNGAPADVLMLDLSLPDMPGAKLVEQLASMTSVPPIVLYSAASPAELDEAASRIGATAILRKPCDAKDLLHATRRAAAQSASPSNVV
jgi:DNA-binding response OmpR family regulator